MKTAIEPETDSLEAFIAKLGCRHGKNLGDGLYAAIRPFMYTHAIIVGEIGDEIGYLDRWCYHSEATAVAALAAWDGAGEPEGWHRHPATGRRRSESPDEIDDEGRRVGAVGVLFRRR